MTSGNTGRMIAVAFCACAMSAGVCAAEWQYGEPTAPLLTAPETVAMPSPGCSQEPCIRLWSQMSAAERAKIWPFLDEVVKSTNWREMTHAERNALKANLSDSDRERLRRRFSVDPSLAERTDTPPQKRRGLREARLPVPRMDREERRRMREQILEVHRRRP